MIDINSRIVSVALRFTIIIYTRGRIPPPVPVSGNSPLHIFY